MVRVLEAKLKEDLEEKTRFQAGWKGFEDRWIGFTWPRPSKARSTWGISLHQ